MLRTTEAGNPPSLFVLLTCLFVTMIGLGITLPVLPFYVERLTASEAAPRQFVAMQIVLLTAAYAVGQFIFAPIWGRLSDQTGRRPLLLVGIAGYVFGQILFGLATSLWLLYAARILGGILSAATLPVSAAYVADATTEQNRSRGMAWLGTATNLGFVVGPGIGGMLSRRDLHFRTQYGHLLIDSFSVPFFVAAALGIITFFLALRWLPESKATPRSASKRENANWQQLVHRLGPLLGLVLIAQFALAAFEGTFALYAQAALDYGPVRIGIAFMVCGLVMTVFQAAAVGFLAQRVHENQQIAVGFGLIGMGLLLLTAVRAQAVVFSLVGLLALGTALLSPNLAALISKRSGNQHVGESLGIQNATNSLAQATGPVLGGALYVWRPTSPYLLAGALSIAVALIFGWSARQKRHKTRPG